MGPDEGAGIPLADKVAFLSAPTAYDPPPPRVQVEETHMSWVFLAGDRVFKLKKPVRYPYLDFSTLAARERDCRAEVRLNRRLAPDVYLGVVPLSAGVDGRMAIGGRGAVVDWLVEMTRLPADRMLDAVLARGPLPRAESDALGARLGGFHAGLPPAGVTPDDFLAGFAREQAVNREVLAGPVDDVIVAAAQPVLDVVDQVLAECPSLLRERAVHGCVVEGHGDLRAEHVCLIGPPVVIDCLEFNRALRCVDPVDELIVLGLDGARLGDADLGPTLMAHAAPRFTEGLSPELVRFYVSYRACVRARLALDHLTDPTPRHPEKWRPLARSYLTLAREMDVSRYSRPAAR